MTDEGSPIFIRLLIRNRLNNINTDGLPTVPTAPSEAHCTFYPTNQSYGNVAILMETHVFDISLDMS